MKWNKGMPETPGWYATQYARDTRGWQNAYRWWDGGRWSWPAFPHESAVKAAKWAGKKESKGYNSEIIWGTI